MQNLFKNTEFMMGVTQYEKLPEDTGTEILLAGRSNAGKSSALNALTENKKLARISKTPGRTTEVNYFRVNEVLKLVDLPGYGYAKSGHSRKKDWGPLLSQYFNMRQSLKAVLLFMDIRHPLKETDIDLINLCMKSEVDCIPVLTKSDKLSKNKVAQTIAKVSKDLGGIDTYAVSSKDIVGFIKLSKLILSY
jgi:GTP-binding protein